ncbi:hypothetical protein NQ318_023201, partial [Aromia moschata]
MTSALASLTATYTDSEGEEEGNEEQNSNEGVVTVKSPSAGSPSDNNLQVQLSSVSPQKLLHWFLIMMTQSHPMKMVNPREVPHQVVMMSDNDKKDDNEGMDDDDGITIPPEPPGHCSIELQEKITKLYEKMQTQQLDMNGVIQKRKDFRNPSIYEKLIQFCGLNEL